MKTYSGQVIKKEIIIFYVVYTRRTRDIEMMSTRSWPIFALFSGK